MKYFNSQVKVGDSDQEDEHLVSNIMAAVQKLNEVVPGGGRNIRSLQLKTHSSPALKIYWSGGNVDFIPRVLYQM